MNGFGSNGAHAAAESRLTCAFGLSSTKSQWVIAELMWGSAAEGRVVGDFRFAVQESRQAHTLPCHQIGEALARDVAGIRLSEDLR
jgi:hypothetical protein